MYCICLSVYVYVSYRFDKEVSDLMQEMKRGGVLEVRRRPVPPLSSLRNIDRRQWQGLNTSFLHAQYPSLFTY